MGSGHAKQQRQRVSEDGLDAAPGVHHGTVAVEIILMELRRNGDHGRDRDRVGVLEVGANPIEKVGEVVDAAGGPSGRGVLRNELDGRVEHDDPGAVEAVACAGRVHGVDRGVRVGDLFVAVDHHQHAVATNSPQTGRPHQQPADDAALDVQGILGHLVDVGSVHDVRVHDQIVAHRRQEAGDRSRVAGMAADCGIDTGRNEENDIEASEFSNGRLRNWKIDGIASTDSGEVAARRLRMPTSQWQRAFAMSLEQTTNRTGCSPSASRSCTNLAKKPSASSVALGQGKSHSCSYSRISASPEARDKIFVTKARAKDQLSRRADRVNRREVDAVEHVS